MQEHVKATGATYKMGNQVLIDDYFRQMEIEANKADKRKGAK